MSDQLWGTCPWCQRRKRVTKAEEPLLYTHDRPGGNFPCLGSGQDPKEGSVRNAAGDTPEELAALADRVSLTKPVETYIRSGWPVGMTNAEIVQELRDLIDKGPAVKLDTWQRDALGPGKDFVDTYSNESLIDTWEDEGGWGWEAVIVAVLVAVGVGSFLAGWWWARR